MRFLIFVLSIILVSFFAQLYLSWWSIALIAALAGVWSGYSPIRSFSMGFLAIFLLWAGYAFWLDMGNESILSEKLKELFGGVPGALLILITGVIGGLVGGLGALTGSLWTKLFAFRSSKL